RAARHRPRARRHHRRTRRSAASVLRRRAVASRGHDARAVGGGAVRRICRGRAQLLGTKEESVDGNVTSGRRATGIASPERSFVSPLRRYLLSIAFTLLAGQAFAGPWLTSVDAAQKKAKAGHQLIFVDLFADWCGWCHRFEQEVIPSEAFQSATDKMVLLRLNTEDGKDGTKVARDYRVASLPTFVVLDEDGRMAGRNHAVAPPPALAYMSEETLGHYNDFQKRSNTEPSFAKDYQKRLDLAKEYRERNGYSQSEARLNKLLGEQGVPVN